MKCGNGVVMRLWLTSGRLYSARTLLERCTEEAFMCRLLVHPNDNNYKSLIMPKASLSR